MVKALIKKELLQFLSIYTYDKKKGKQRSAGVAALILAVLGLAFVSFSFMFFALYSSVAPAVRETGEPWLLFSMAGVVTLLISILGSAFTTYSILYKAKDNELLLSMPIPPGKILFVRMLTVFAFSLFFCAIAWGPSLAAYFLEFGFSPAVLTAHIITCFALTAFVTAVTCVLGWLIALCSGLFRNKTLVSVLLFVVFIAAYYTFYFRMQSIVSSVIENISGVSAAMHGWGRPLMVLGRGACGEWPQFALVIAVCAALLALTCLVLSRTLFGLLTSSAKTKRAVYREKHTDAKSAASALLGREFKRFFSSATLIMNTGFGVLILLAGCVAALIKAPALRELLTGPNAPGFLKSCLGVLPALIAGMVMSMDCLTASSVSLEGKQIWLMQSAPVSSKLVLRMKEAAHLLINGVPAAIAAIVFGLVLGNGIAETLLGGLFAAAFVWLTAGFGLMMNVLKPDLDWVNESVPVKQGLPVLFSMLFGFGVLATLAVLMISFCLTLGPVPALLICTAIACVPALIIDRWIGNKGAERFAHIE